MSQTYDLIIIGGGPAGYVAGIRAAQLKLKILDEWGERSTVVKGSEKMLASLNAIGVIQRVKQGRYVLAPRVDADEELSLFLLHADMLAYQSGYRSYTELQALPELFPFVLHASKERLVEDARFSIGNFGREFTVSLNQC